MAKKRQAAASQKTSIHSTSDLHATRNNGGKEALPDQTDRLFFNLAEHLLDLVLEIELDGRILYASSSSRQVLGCVPEDLVNRSFFSLVHPDDSARVRAWVLSNQGAEEPLKDFYRIEHRIGCADRPFIWVETVGQALVGEDHSAPVILTIRDITERLQAEMLQKALYRISEAAHTAQDLQSLYQLVHEVVAGLFPARNLYIALYDSEAETIHFPYYIDEKEDLVSSGQKFSVQQIEKSLTWYLLKTGQSLLVSPEAFEELERKGEVESLGAPSVDWLGTPLKNAEGKTIGMLAVQTYTEGERYGEHEKNILGFVSAQIAMAIEQKMMHEALRKSEERLNLAIEAAQIGMWDFNPQADELVTNQKFTELLGFPREKIGLKRFRSLLQSSEIDIAEDIFFQKVNPQAPNFDLEFCTNNGHPRWFQMFGKATAFRSDGAAARFTGTIQDITGRKKNEGQLRRKDAVLEAVSFAAERFLKTSDWESSIHEVLLRLGCSIGADRAYIYRVQDIGSEEVMLQYKYEWVSEGRSSILKALHPEIGLREWIQILRTNKAVYGVIQDTPLPERPYFEDRSIYSTIHVPIFAEQQFWGVIAFDTCSEGHDLSITAADVLRTAADILGAAIQNQATEKTLRETEIRQRAMLNAQPDIIFLTSAEGVYLDCYTSNPSLLAASPSDMIGKRLQDFVPPDLAKTSLEVIQKVLQTGEVEAYDYSLELNGKLYHFGARAARCDLQSVLTIVRDISDRKQTEKKLREANDALTVWVRELEQRNKQSLLLNRMGEMLQSCLTTDEAYQVARQYCEQLFEKTSGAIYILNNSKNLLEEVAKWGDGVSGNPIFGPEACWALRRGRLHMVPDPHKNLTCSHLKLEKSDGVENPYLCIPMIAQGDTLGLLHVQCECDDDIESWDTLATSVAEQVGLAISNLNLRQILQSQSIRDGLTNLFNRRYMQDTLERELSRAKRFHLPLSVAMADIDHFKNYNDTLGHEAGDLALQEIGGLLMNSIRKEDIPCRYGGDELAIILPGASVEDCFTRIDQFRQAVRRLGFRYADSDQGIVTVSIGIAGYPPHASSVKELLKSADEALYTAKQRGRDQVVIRN
jgi:diguanylate cyclase (GGDEF)-like protein/PAS domain S-box-containing protein